jgi:TRAP-type C4-dicarboxylate transport system substrate-binding protein
VDLADPATASTRTSWIRSRRAAPGLVALVLVVLSACTGGVTAKSGGQAEPRELTLMAPGGREVPYAPAIERFAVSVGELSGGSLVVAVDWGHERRLDPDAEESTIRAVRDGEADLAHAPTRTFDLLGIDWFRALQDPMTLDTMDKADAVASSEVGRRMLEDLRAGGLVGLAMYAESLRRPVGYRSALVRPEDFAGLRVRSQPSALSYRILEELGAQPSMSSTYASTVDGLRYDGAESTWFSWAGRQPFPKGARITGDVVLFPKFNVLLAGRDVFDALDATERAALTSAAQDTVRWWVEEYRPSEDELALAWCTGQRRLVMAGPDGAEAVREALRPVSAELEADEAVARDLRAVRAVAARHPGAFEPPPLCLPPTGDGGWLDD